MIWIRSLPRQDGDNYLRKMDRALTWLLAQTGIFGITTAILLTVVSTFYPNNPIVQDMIFLSLLGFGGGFCGTVILFYMISAITSQEE